MKKKHFWGIVFSFILITLDALVGILFVPFLLKGLGDSEYGLYKLLVSTASYLAILDFGIGGTMTRYIVKFKVEKNETMESNFMAMGIIIYGFLAIIVVLISLFFSILLPFIYQNSINQELVNYAKLVFFLICSNTAISLFNHAYNGILQAYEKFAYSRLSSITKLVLRVVIITILFNFKKSALIIVLVDISLTTLLLVSNILFVRFVVKKRIHFYFFDKQLAKEAFLFTITILLESIINQFNSNIDSIALGVYSTTAIVAMYSLVLQIYNMFSSISTCVSTVYMPTVSKSVFEGDDNLSITHSVVPPSRIQFSLLLLALLGFIAFGKSFISIWVGNSYIIVYNLCLILLISSILELSQNSITNILKAKNMLKGRIIILLIATAINAAITFAVTPFLGPYGAVTGTAFSMIFGYGVALNIYYKKKVGLYMKEYFSNVFSGFWKIAILFVVASISICLFVNINHWWVLLLCCIAYSIVYFVFLYLLVLKKTERKRINFVLKRVFRR